MTQNHNDNYRPEFAIAYGAVALSGALMGFIFGILAGWLIWA